MKFKKAASVAALTISFMSGLMTTAPVHAASPTSYIGTIFATGAKFCPRNTVEAKGQLVAISQFEALYSVIGYAYGGDGRVSFGLPDLRARALVGVGTGPGLTPTPRGLKNGQQFVTLTSSNLPSHTHTSTFDKVPQTTFAVSTNNASHPTPVNNDWIATKKQGFATQNSYIAPADKGTTAKVVASNTASSSGGTVSLLNAGSGIQMGINTPSIVIRYCVVTQGVYPPRT
ncbi:MAG: phage tail protein [Terasakiella sp.]|uniref:phage tail protein n=1 Tax=unclassified Terasakiella TaxID=2614952 RepID=UPI003B00500D